jgi:cytochrome P450
MSAAHGEPAPTILDPGIQECPFDYYAQVLHAAPLVFDERAGFWICGDYELMREMLRNTDVFRSHGSQTIDGLRPPPEEVTRLRRTLVPMVDTLVTNDPPAHTRVRGMMDNPYKPRNVAALTAGIADIVNETLDEFLHAGACDFVHAYAIPVPIKVIADQLGVPRSLAPKIKEWSDASVEPLGMMVSDERLIACTKLQAEFQAYFTAELQARMREPRDDLLSHVANVKDDAGNGFSLPEMLSLTSQLLVAGNETTTNAIAAGMQWLIEKPELFDMLHEAPERAGQFSDEVLRLESPVQGLFRIVARETRIGGVTLPAGARVMLRFAAANRDPKRFPCPAELDRGRDNAGTHLAFGAGVHHCLGANLAREEMVQTFAILPQRLSRPRFPAGRNDFLHHPSMVLRGLKHLHIEFDPRTPSK